MLLHVDYHFSREAIPLRAKEIIVITFEPEKLTLHQHAIQRISERSKMTSDEAIERIRTGLLIVRNPVAYEYGVLFWSHIDGRAYVAFFNRFAHLVTTVIPAYREKADGSVHMMALSPAEGRPGQMSSDDYHQLKLHRHEIRECMVKAGVPIDLRFQEKGNAQRERRALFMSAIVSLFSEDRGMERRVLNSKKISDEFFGQPALGEFIPALITQLKKKNMLDRLVTAEVFVKAADGTSRTLAKGGGSVFNEWHYSFEKSELMQAAENIGIRPFGLR